MKYAFLSTLIPKEMENEVNTNSSKHMQDAANALQWNIYEGLQHHLEGKIDVFNVLPVDSYPQYYTKAHISKKHFATKYSATNINIGFCNIKYIRKLSISVNVYRELDVWCSLHNEKKIIIVYTISTPFLSALYRLKRKHKDLQLCAIVADLPDMFAKYTQSFLKRTALTICNKFNTTSMVAIDAFVLLTKQMADYLHVSKPFTVVEGICTTMHPKPRERKNNRKIILYSGILAKLYGVMNILYAFEKIDNPNYTLIFCGIGDCENEIKEAAKRDRRIIFKGKLSREEVLTLQTEASVLVNPRQNTEEFTKYSFPSKNLEYLSSGTPLVAYKLDGIPDEYDDYINYVNDNSVEGLKNMLLTCCEDIDGRYSKKAKAGAAYVKNIKSPEMQTLKIVNLLNQSVC